jgi:hypothetical protein
VSQPKSRSSPSLRWLARLGVVSGVVVAVAVNVLSVRFDHRWDITPDHRYSLSPATRSLLDGLADEVTFTVLLARGDPLAPTVEQLLGSYRARSRRIRIDWVDPDRKPAEFAARQAELGIVAGRTEDGKVITDTIVVIGRGSRHYYVTTDDVVEVESDGITVQSHLEQVVSIGIRRVNETGRVTVCVTHGHRELSVQDRSPEGLRDFAERLGHEDMDVVALALADSAQPAVSCGLVVVPGPEIPLSTPIAERLLEQARKGSSLLLLGGLALDETGTIRSAGFEPITTPAGIVPSGRLVIETDEEHQLPNVDGETFIASALEHPITEGLRRPDTQGLDVVVSVAQALTPAPTNPAAPLLGSTPQAHTVTHFVPGETTVATEKASFVVAMAGRLPEAANGPGGRVVVMPASLVTNRFLSGPAEMGARAFVDSTVSWLLDRPRIDLAVPEPSQRPAGLVLSEADLERLTRYVLLVMPLTAGLLGVAFVLWRRRDARPRCSRPRGDGA